MNNYEIPAIGFSEAATKNLGKYGRIESTAQLRNCAVLSAYMGEIAYKAFH